MVDVDRRLTSHAHVAGLKRFSARASKGPLPSSSPRQGCFSFAPLARTVVDRLRNCHIQIARGLSDEEFCRIEAPFAFSFPPDLKAILQEGLPVGAGFPDWRSGGLKQLRMTLNLPIAGLTYEVARGRFWCKQWGPRPSDTEQAVSVARAALRKVPILIPVYRYCYIPASPNLAGNPVFFVCQKDVFYCGYDLANFFERENFVPYDYELPFDFASLDVIHGRAASLLDGSGDWVCDNGRSFRIEKPLDMPRHSSEGDGGIVFDCGREDAELAELAEQGDDRARWKGEEPRRDLEGWGRNVDVLAKRFDHSTRNGELSRRSFEVLDSRQALKRCDHALGSATAKLPSRFLPRADERSPSAKSAPPARTVRRIEFWSDLAEKKASAGSENLCADHLFSCGKVDGEVRGAKQQQQQRAVPYWLERYLDEMASLLRSGGWKEADVLEMMSAVSPSPGEPNSCLDRQSILEGLVLYVNVLSDVLRRAGWSTQDVAEAFDVDLSCGEEQLQKKRRPPAVPPHLVARIGKLAEYVAKF